ncbi:MAG: archease [Candidatus Micrarchaeota archaeon]
MKQFESLDIATADMAFAAYGRTKNELFENAARGLFAVMFEKIKVSPKEKRVIEIENKDEIMLLHNFLAELLYSFDTEHIIMSDIKVKISGNRLRAEMKGEKYDPKKHRFIIDVKAITYHKMAIEKMKDGTYKCVVIVDT